MKSRVMRCKSAAEMSAKYGAGKALFRPFVRYHMTSLHAAQMIVCAGSGLSP